MVSFAQQNCGSEAQVLMDGGGQDRGRLQAGNHLLSGPQEDLLLLF